MIKTAFEQALLPWFLDPGSVALCGGQNFGYPKNRPLLARVLRQIWAEDIGISSKFDPQLRRPPKNQGE